jgi:hypothetical protein
MRRGRRLGGSGRNPEAVAARLEKWVDAVGSATLPLLAGFSTTSVIVVSDDAANFRWPGATVLALAIASVLLIGAVQFAYHARIDLSIWSDRKDRKESSVPLLDDNGGDADTRDAKNPQDRHHQTGLTWTKWTHFAYHWGLFALLAGLALAVAPHHAMGIQGTCQRLATFLALVACVGEFAWIGWWHWWSRPWRSRQRQRLRATRSQRDALADRERSLSDTRPEQG